MIGTQQAPLCDIATIDLKNLTSHSQIIERPLSKKQVTDLLDRINVELNVGCCLEIDNGLKLLRKQLKCKYSICLSNEIIDKFIITTGGPNCTLGGFGGIEKEIKSTAQQINRKRYFFDKRKVKQQRKKLGSADKRKRRNILNVQSMPSIKSHKNIQELYLRQKLFILKEYISEDQMSQIEQLLLNRLQAVQIGKYGKHAEKIKKYTVYDYIIQRIFSLIQEDANNIVIRQRYENIYRKMKEQMVSIAINQEQVNNVIRAIAIPSKRSTVKPKPNHKQPPKRHFYQLQRDKIDLTSQIEETILTAKKTIKEALIKKGRPDYAYQLELSLANRTTPFALSRKRL